MLIPYVTRNHMKLTIFSLFPTVYRLRLPTFPKGVCAGSALSYVVSFLFLLLFNFLTVIWTSFLQIISSLTIVPSYNFKLHYSKVQNTIFVTLTWKLISTIVMLEIKKLCKWCIKQWNFNQTNECWYCSRLGHFSFLENQQSKQENSNKYYKPGPFALFNGTPASRLRNVTRPHSCLKPSNNSITHLIK